MMGCNIAGYLKAFPFGFPYQFNRTCGGYGAEVDPRNGVFG